MPNAKSEEKVIRNPSLEDIQKLKLATTAESKTHDEINIEKNNEKTIDTNTSLKPKRSIFDPEPELIKLPSQNFVLKNNLTKNNEIFIRRLTIVEEQLLFDAVKTVSSETEAFKQFNVLIDSILDNCIVSNISVFDLSLIDKFPLLAKVIDMTYGNIIVKRNCDECETPYELSINVYKDFKIRYLPKSTQYPKKIKLSSYKDEIFWSFHFPTIAETNVIFNSTILESMLSITDVIEGEITDLDGTIREITEDDYSNILANMNTKDREEYQAYINEFSSYGIQMSTELSFCKNNGCKLKNKPQTIEFPVSEIFQKIISQTTNNANINV